MLELVRIEASEASRALEAGGDLAGKRWSDGAASADDLTVLGIAADGVPTWLVMDEHRVLGMCGTHAPVIEGQSAEIGYHVAEGERHHGLAGMAVRLLLDELEALGASEVRAEVDRGSRWADASRAVLVSCGFAATAPDSELPRVDRFIVSLS